MTKEKHHYCSTTVVVQMIILFLFFKKGKKINFCNPVIISSRAALIMLPVDWKKENAAYTAWIKKTNISRIPIFLMYFLYLKFIVSSIINTKLN